MNQIMVKAGKVMVRAGRVLVNTAACIARCCGACPGPILRRKCDRWCPDTQQVTGFYRIDLNAFVSPGVTWAQWIAANDAALTPCRLIKFGANPEDCYVLDRNCSRCFWPAGCPYVLNYAALPVATFQNPSLATCAQCIACADCCDSALFLDCFGVTTCHECGSSYRTSYQFVGHSTRVNGQGLMLHEISREHTITSVHDCTPSSGCNTSTMQWTNAGQLHVNIREPDGQGGQIVYDRTRVEGTGQTTAVTGPNHCSHITDGLTAISNLECSTALRANNSDAAILNSLIEADLSSSTGLVTALGPGLNRQCSGTRTIHFGGPFSGLYTNDKTWTWTATFNERGAFVTITYSHQSYSIPGNVRILNTDTRATAQYSYQITKIDDCSPSASNGCVDRLVRAGGSGHQGGNQIGPSPITMNPGINTTRQTTEDTLGTRTTGGLF